MSKSAPKLPVNHNRRPPKRPARENARWATDRYYFAAANDLAVRVFDLARDAADDWPEGAKRVQRARQYVMARLQGKRPRAAPLEDLALTASLLCRVLEDELLCELTDVVAIFDEVGLPTDDVPIAPRVPRAAIIPFRQARRPVARVSDARNAMRALRAA